MKISKQDIKSLLNGDLFRAEAIRKQYPLLGLVAVLIMAYILAGYHAIDQKKQIVSLQKEIENNRFEYLSLYTEYIRATRQTVVLDQLEALDSDLEINMRPLIQLEMTDYE